MEKNVYISIDNANMCSLWGDPVTTNKLYQAFLIRHPDAWHILMHQRRGGHQWDGYIKYISATGKFRIGLLPKVYHTAQELGAKVTIEDNRKPLGVKPIIPTKLSDRELYPEQINALKALLNNKIGGVPFLICAGDYSVGFGKSILFASIHEAFQRKLKTILLLNDSNLFNQFKREIPPMLAGEDIQFIQGGNATSWGNFNVAMVQSLSRNLKKYQYLLSQVDIVLIDEADVIDNRTYKSVIERLYGARIRIGLSGTIYMDNTKKKLVHNMNIMSFIGDKVDEVRLHQQIKKGRATPVIVKMVEAPFEFDKKGRLSYDEEYSEVVIKNKESYKFSLSRAVYNYKYGRMPMIIVCKFINHCEKLYKYYIENNTYNLRIEHVHHKSTNRDAILNDFRQGKIDILISTLIISRGQNFPELRYIQNLSSMDSQEKSIQILGRLVRKSEGKNRTYLDDLCFPGKYLERHNKHRKTYYQKEKLKVIIVKNKNNSVQRVKNPKLF